MCEILKYSNSEMNVKINNINNENIFLDILSDSVNNGFNQRDYREDACAHLRDKHVFSLIRYLKNKDLQPEIRYAHIHTLNPHEINLHADDGRRLQELFHGRGSLCFDFPKLGGRIFRVRRSNTACYLCIDAVRNNKDFLVGVDNYSNTVLKMSNSTIDTVLGFFDELFSNI